MIQKRLLKHLTFLMFFIFLANFFILKFYWYSLVWYLDIIMHLLGGLWVGLFFLYILSRRSRLYFSTSLVLKLVFYSLIVGIIWELYELRLNIISSTSFNLGDTLSDILFDLLGLVVSLFYYFKIIMSEWKNKVQ